ncbi:small acid-soluble spore protein Tlp [Virgibacillus siamensis]|uniref:small acid-soluble spore protein Tlp n=1 Tax=Virgibacillus siamensis TaxID=480071 RepID=UPI000987316C|nr:small acid-soluble spore protein Tlp [Virgibacillus siamensis]
MPDKYEPKPDDRSDNAEKLQNMIHDTLENMEEAEETMEFSSGQEKEQIREKNQRRKDAVKGMRQEIKDETDL